MSKRIPTESIDTTINCFLCLEYVRTHERCRKCRRLIHKEFYVEDLDEAPRCLKVGDYCYRCASRLLSDNEMI